MRRIYPAIMILLIIPVPVFLGNYMKKTESRIYGMYPPDDFCEMDISKTNFHNITIDLQGRSVDIKSLCNGTRSFTPPSISRNVTVNRSGNSTILLINDIIKMGDRSFWSHCKGILCQQISPEDQLLCCESLFLRCPSHKDHPEGTFHKFGFQSFSCSFPGRLELE